MYGRIIRVEARYEPDADPFFWTDELRVKVLHRSSIGADAISTTKVTIYNLAHTTIKALTKTQKDTNEAGNSLEKTYIRVYAGYEDELTEDGELPLIVEGFVQSATAYRDLPENLTELYVLPLAAAALSEPFETINATAGWTLEDAIMAVLDGTGIQPDYFISDADRNQPVQITLAPTEGGRRAALDELGEAYYFRFVTTATGLRILPLLDDSIAGQEEYERLVGDASTGQTEAIPIHPVMVRGTPILGKLTIELTVNLDQRLQVGSLLDLSEVIAPSSGDTGRSVPIASTSGIGDVQYYSDNVYKYAVMQHYMIYTLVIEADNFARKGGWGASVLGSVPAAGQMGEIEFIGG